MLPALKPIMMRERVSLIFIEYGQIDVVDSAFVVIDKNGVRTHIPIGGIACIMLEPGTRVSRAAAALAARVGTLLVWVGEAGVRLYAAGQPGGARSDRLLYQAQLALDETLRLKVVRKMYELRFNEKPPGRRGVDQLRGIEGARVKPMYKLMAQQYRVDWNGTFSITPGKGQCAAARSRMREGRGGILFVADTRSRRNSQKETPGLRQVFLRLAKVSRQRRPRSLRVPPLTFVS